MAADPAAVDEASRVSLPDVPVSLAVKLREGVSDFQEMGLDKAYSGSPSQASASEGEQMLDRLAEMVATEVLESMNREERAL